MELQKITTRNLINKYNNYQFSVEDDMIIYSNIYTAS